MLVFVLALVLMLANAAAAAAPLAMPMPADSGHSSAQAMHDGHCPHAGADAPADRAMPHHHGRDCACCIGAVCACPTLCAALPIAPRFAMTQAVDIPRAESLVVADYSAFAARPLRPPIV